MSLIITHNSGFFSCCAVKLTLLVDYINENLILPSFVDSSSQFKMYKDKDEDVTFKFFEHYDNININITYPIIYHWDHQFINYSNLDYSNLIPIIKKYFTPSKIILDNLNKIKHKYNINYNDCIAVYYRGTDKYCETQLSDFETFYDKIQEILKLEKNTKQIIIQTDTAQFLDFIYNKKMDNIIVFHENNVSYENKGIHYEKTPSENANDILFLFPIFLLIAKCKYIICSSGNVSEWMMFYRGNNKNVHQYLNGSWYKLKE